MKYFAHPPWGLRLSIVLLTMLAVSAVFAAGQVFRGQVYFRGATEWVSGSTLTVDSGATITLNGTNIFPVVIGGTAASSTLTLESTSGTGTSDAIKFLTGSQAEAGRITTGGVWVFGSGEAGASPVGQTLRAPSAAGTDKTGAALQINGGISTGTGLGGSIVFGVANKAGTGTTANSIGNVFTIAPPNTGTTAPVDGVTLTSAIASGTVTIAATGTDAAIPLTISGKGTGVLTLNTATISSAGVLTVGSSVIGGTAVSAALKLQSTSGVGSTDSIQFLVGNNGATEAGRILTSGVWVIGAGEAGATPAAQTLRSPAAAGTDIAGVSLTIAGGPSTGTGLGGSLLFQVANKQATGTTANALATVFTIAPPNTGTTAPVNGLTLTSAITTGTVTLAATGSDAAIPLTISTKSTGLLTLNTATISSTGIVTPVGGVAVATGTADTVFHSGGVPAITTTQGTDTTPVTTETYICEVFIPHNATLTGISILNGSATNANVAVALADNTGAIVASSGAVAQAGTNAYQQVAFSSTYAAKGPAKYFILLQHSNVANRYRTHILGNFGASKKTGETFGVFTSITPPTTFTTNLGPIADTY